MQDPQGQPGEPVWDRFLTPRDRKHLILRPRQSQQPVGRSPALVIVDLYRGMFGNAPQPILEAVPDWPSSCGLEAWDSLPRAQRLLAAARDASVPVVHTTGSTKISRRSESNVVDDEERALDRRRQYALMEELEPIDGELVVEKTAPSAFWGTPLLAYLVRSRVDTLVIAGASTSGCVRATVVDARSHGFFVMVVEDCVFDRHEFTHAANLFDMGQKYAQLAPAAEAVTYLAGGEAAGSGLAPAGFGLMATSTSRTGRPNGDA